MVQLFWCVALLLGLVGGGGVVVAQEVDLLSQYSASRDIATFYSSGGPDAVSVALASKAIRLDLKVPGGSPMVSDSGRRQGSAGFYLTNPNGVTGLSASMKVSSYGFGKCAANPAVSSMNLRLFGYWFNDGSSSGAGDLTGNYYATVGLNRTADVSGQELNIIAFIWRCGNRWCSSGEFVTGPIVIGIAKKNKLASLGIEWDQFNHRFRVVMVTGSGKKVTVQESFLDYPSATPTNLPVSDSKGGELANSAARCQNEASVVSGKGEFSKILVLR
jgi:hypothetical protein